MRICIGKDRHKLISDHYNNAIEYKPITREDTSIVSNGIMLIHKGIGGKSLVIRQRLIKNEFHHCQACSGPVLQNK